MSFVFEQPRSSSADTFAGGVASISDIYAAAREQMLYVDNTNAASAAMERAFDERIGEVFEATGVKLDNPLRALRPGTFPSREAMLDAADPAGRFQARVEDAARRIPDQSVVNRLTRSIDTDAIRIARESDERLAGMMASRGGATKWLGAIGGGIAGAMHDPLQVGTLVIGGGPGAGRTIAARILSGAAKEALVNGAVEAAMQPQVQAWREKAGLDHGLQQALLNVGFAASLGGLFGTAGQGLAEGLRLSGRGLDVAGDVAIAEPRIAEPVRQAMAGDVAAARQTLPEIRDALPAQARGALDHAETLDHLDSNRPSSVIPERHDLNVSQAHRALDDIDAFPGFQPDTAQIARIVNDIAGPDVATTPNKARSLIGFLIDHGGVAPDPELGAIGADTISQAFRGRLVKDQGSTLDYAREMAAEAGYFDHIHGDPATATARTTIADFLDAIDQETRGNPLFPGGEMGELVARDQAAARSGLEGLVADIARHAGPGVDDALIREAADLAIGDNLDAFDALERVFIRQESTEARVAVKASRNGNPLPGWSDDELEAASVSRGAEPSAEQGLDDPANVQPEHILSNADFMLPDETERLARAEKLGFTIEAFHGTNDVFDQFRLEKLGSNTGSKSAEKGFFFAKNPNTSHAYLSKGELIIFDDIQTLPPEDAAKLPSNVKRMITDAQDANQKRIDAVDDDAYDYYSDLSSRLWEQAHEAASEWLKEGQNIWPVRLKMENPLIKDYGGETFRDISYSDIIDQAKKSGHDGVILQNTFDGADMDDVYVVFSPEQIRSKFDLFEDTPTSELDELVAEGDAIIPGEDGRLMPVSAYFAEIEREAELATIVRACRA